MEIVRVFYNDDQVKKLPVRWTAMQNLHLTLQFLGDTEEKRVSQIKGILDNILPPHHAEQLTLTGVGAFPNPSSPRIIWIGFDKNDYLMKMQQLLTHSLETAGFEVDRKRYRPHLTLGRVRENSVFPSNALQHLESITGKMNFASSPLDRVTLYESILRPGGPVYSAVYEKLLNR